MIQCTYIKIGGAIMLLGHKKLEFLNTPTPIDYLENISKEIGVNLYIKRDDLTNLGMGGNKLRKLEYLIYDAKEKGATMVITVGGAQTNHGRLTAAVAAKYGLNAAIVAIDPYPGEISANLLLDGIMNCPVYLMDFDGIHTEAQLLDIAVPKVIKEWEDKGETVFFIPMGGSNELGILGYYECAMEIVDQVKTLDIESPRIVTTVGSFGTYMGLQVGIKNENLPLRLTGIGVIPRPNGIVNFAQDYYSKIKTFYNLDLEIASDEYDLTSDYDCGKYNNPVKEVRDAMYYMGSKEAIILDPCYTGKTFYGLLEMVKTGKIKQGENVIFLHTGGVPGIYTKHHRIELERELIGNIHII